MIDDLLLEPDDEGQPPPGPALIIPANLSNRELIISEQIYRMRGHDLACCGPIMFTTEMEDGTEIWDEREARRWQKMMGWPREPTIAEAQAFKMNADARVAAAEWFALFGTAPGRA